MKRLSAALGGLALLASSALPAFAQTIDPCPKGDFNALCSRFGVNSVGNIIQTVITFLLIAAVIIALFYLIWGGIRWITSGGDKGKVDEARKHIVAAIIGLIVAFVAYFILQIILTTFGLGPINEIELPTF